MSRRSIVRAEGIDRTRGPGVRRARKLPILRRTSGGGPDSQTCRTCCAGRGRSAECPLPCPRRIAMPDLPSAITTLPFEAVTILFTDIERSTALWEQDAARMSRALAAHDALARGVVEARRGTVIKMTGDGMHAVFEAAHDALAASLDLQQAVADPAATEGLALRVRCGIHAGLVERRDNDCFGGPVNRAARIMASAHGGQVLLSQAVVELLHELLPVPVTLRDLGSVRLKDLATPERVYQAVHPALRQDFPALRSLEATPNNLPQQPTSFIGRAKEQVDVEGLLGRVRLLTLTGSGGCGKTRLALQVAADALDRYADGVWFVELAPVSDPERVPQSLAAVLGLKEEPGVPLVRTLTDHLKDRRLLLLLDNCEHLLDACAHLVDAMLRHCPGVRILASSREALGIAGEQAYRVPSLSLPDPQGGAHAGLGDSIRSGSAVPRTRAPCPRGFRDHRTQRRGGRLDLPPARRHPVRARACRSSRAFALGRGYRRQAERALPAADRGLTHRSAPAADAAGADRLELRPSERARAIPAAAAFRVRGRVDARGCRACVRRRRPCRGGDPRPAHLACGQEPRRRRPRRWRLALPVARDGAAVRARPIAGGAWRRGDPGSASRLLRRARRRSRGATDRRRADGVAAAA